MEVSVFKLKSYRSMSPFLAGGIGVRYSFSYAPMAGGKHTNASGGLRTC